MPAATAIAATRPTGGAHGDETRAAILMAARVRFALYPYADATIRAIARDAGVSPALVIKYFGDKERLLRAVVDYDEVFVDLLAGPLDDLGTRLVQCVIERIDEPGASDPFLALLLMTVSRDTPDWVRSDLLDGFVARLRDRLVGPDAGLRAELVCAQLIGLSAMRQVFEAPDTAGETAAGLAHRMGGRLQALIDG